MAAAATIWEGLVDQSPWGSVGEFAEAAIQPYDRNGDGSICLRTIWEDRNRKSNWYGALLFIPRDNNANASTK